MTVFTCERGLEAMMTCIYQAWEWALQHGHQNVRLELEPVLQTTLFENYEHVEPDVEKAAKVVRSIQKKISKEAYLYVYYACLAQEDELDTIYRFLRVGFRNGGQVVHMLAEPSVMRMMELRRRVGNEIHLSREFLRFTSIGERVYISHLEPKNQIVYEVALHFADRMPSEHWMIIDDNRKIAVVHPADQEMYLQQLNEEQFIRLRESEKYGDSFEELWKTFFHTIGIKERENYKCQRTHMPLWMRKHVTEFQK